MHITKECCLSEAYQTTCKLYKRTLLRVTKERRLSGVVPNNVQSLQTNAVACFKRTLLHVTKECCLSGAVQNNMQILQKNAV